MTLTEQKILKILKEEIWVEFEEDCEDGNIIGFKKVAKRIMEELK